MVVLCNTLELDAVVVVGRVNPTDVMLIQYRGNLSGFSFTGRIGTFWSLPVYFFVSMPPKIMLPAVVDTDARSRENAREEVTFWSASWSTILGYVVVLNPAIFPNPTPINPVSKPLDVFATPNCAAATFEVPSVKESE